MASQMPQMSAREVRREQIIDAAVELFGQRGFRGTSVAAVAQRVGVTDAGVLYHFGTKDDLLLAVVDRLGKRQWDEMEEDLRRRGRSNPLKSGGLTALESIRDWGKWMEQRPEENKVLVVLSAEHLTDESEVNTYFAKRYRRLIRRLAQVFEQAAADGDIRSDVDPVREASMLVAMQDGIRLQWFLVGSHRVSMAKVVRDYVDAMIERLTP